MSLNALGVICCLYVTSHPFTTSTGGVALRGSRIAMFIDGTLRKCCRPGGNGDPQREIFDGHHRAHGLVYQGVVFPKGLFTDLHGPISGRRHDAYALRVSNLNARLAEAQAGAQAQYKAYSDAAYPILTRIDRGYRAANLTAAQRAYNRALAEIRVCVEWQFGKVTSLHPSIENKANLKLVQQPIGKYSTVAALISNVHTCLYGSVTGRFFCVNPPSLEDYFDVPPPPVT